MNTVRLTTNNRALIFALTLLLFASTAVQSQELGDNAAAQANNPLANLTAFNIQGYHIGDLSESDNSANQWWLRYAKPFSIGEGTWLLRTSLPYNSFPVGNGGSTKNGIGDFNAFAAYLFDTGNPAVSFGLGPQITAPTATEDRVGSEQWSAGFANVLFDARSAKFQYLPAHLPA